ncbi:efflux RND transporter permease subunit [Hyunsoonleella pacifica]|uniref:RND family transporter n=1 Tax=Hyunsoonleella pacifica TaxID=1080224 RepID=A0A4Q9FTQ0_9FLAO|nr:MMPL family transporter [Hyunsoonleella pacifica]TBN18709.1 RND family transporter [Hyunsoonleella pacifica]GGD04046.1 RND transporter [Hyunsoonleella pacifica]
MSTLKKTEEKLNIFAISWAEFIIKYKWAVLFASVLLVIGIASQGKMEFDGDYHTYFSDDNPELLAFDGLQEKYTKDDNAFIVLTAKNGDIFTKKNLMAIEELAAEAWNTPFSSRVDAITNFQHTRADNDDLYVEDLSYETSLKSEEDIKRIREIALKEPLLVNRLINKDGSITAINVNVTFPGLNDDENSKTVAFVRNMIEEFKQKNPQFDVHLSGIVMLQDAMFSTAQKDMMYTMIMFVIVILMIIILTRNFFSTIVTLLTIIFSIAVSIGFLGITGIKLTPSSASFPTIVLTLAVADSIHILVTFLHNIRKKAMPKNMAIIESLRLNFMPVFITSITTIIGFLSMNFGDVPPFADLGNIVSVGILAALVFSLTFLPAFIAIMPIKQREPQSNTAKYLKKDWLYRFGEYVSANPKKLAGISLVVIGILSVLSFRNFFDDEFIKYFDETVDFRIHSDYISDNITGIYNIEYSIGAGESGGINNPKYLKKLEEFEKWFEKQPKVVHVNSFTEVARRINKSMHGDKEAYYRLPDSRQEAAQYLLLYEMSLPFGLDLNNQVNVDKSETRFTVTTRNLRSSELIALSERGEKWLKDNASEEMKALGTSSTLMFSKLGVRQADSMMSGNIIAMVLISLILMLALRHFKIGLLSIIPNIAPVAIGFGIWALYLGEVNTGMVVVFGMTLGVIVDDTVHFVSKFLRARRELGYTASEAVKYAFETVGKALIITTVVLLSGFLILAQSSFAMTSYMATITTFIIPAALLVDFILLPSLLILVSSDKELVNAKN